MVETGGTPPALLLAALVFLIVLAAAILIGTLLYIVRARNKARSERTHVAPPAPPSPGMEQTEPPLSSDRETEPPESPAGPPPGQPGEVMRVIRDEQTGRILVDVQGQQYAHIREIADPQVGRRVLWAIADLLRFTGGMAANPQAVKNAAQHAAQEQGIPIPPNAEPAESKQAQTTTGTTAPPDLLKSRPPTPLPSAPAPAPLQSIPSSGARAGPRYSILAFFQRGLQPPASVPQSGASSLVDEIEDILQELIQQRAAPLSCEVHVSAGPQNQLQIEVGHRVYGSADKVPDPEVQALIRTAVAEWEKR